MKSFNSILNVSRNDYLRIIFTICFFCTNLAYSQTNEKEKLFKKCWFKLYIIPNLVNNNTDANVKVSIVDSVGYHKEYNTQNKKKIGIDLPFGSVYNCFISSDGYIKKWAIINLKDSLDVSQLKKFNKKFIFFKADQISKDTSSANVSGAKIFFLIEVELVREVELPTKLSENMNFDFPIATIMFDKKLKKFNYNESYTKSILQKLKNYYKKVEVLSGNPELLMEFNKMNDSLKLKEFMLLKEKEKLLNEQMALIEKQNENEKLENEKVLKDALLKEEKANSISKQRQLDLAIQLRINGEQKTKELALKRQIEFEQFSSQKKINDAALNEQKALSLSKQKELDLSKQEKIAKELEAKNANFFKNAFIGIAVFISIISLLLFFAYHNKIKSNKLLEARNLFISHQKQEILDSIEYAKRIQTTILPPPKVVKKYLDDSFILYLPKDIVAGDFYWMESVGDWVLFAACDCTGHGVPGALVSVVCHNALNRAVKEYNKIMPAEILDVVAELVLENFSTDDDVKDGMDASVCALNTATGELYWAGANNPLWLIRHAELDSASVEIIEYKPNKQPIGKFDDRVPYTNHKIEITKGDTIYLFTDGYADQFGGERGKKLTKAKFKEAILNMQRYNLDEQKKYLLDLHLSYKGNLGQVDDICVIGVRV